MIDWRQQAQEVKAKIPFAELIDPVELNEEDKKYLQGKENRAIRWYFYLENGLNILNDFRNLFLGILAIYIALHLTNPLYMVLMFLPCLILLSIIGWYSVHRLNKMKEWLSMRFSTHYGLKNYNFQEQQVKLLLEIKQLLEKNANS